MHKSFDALSRLVLSELGKGPANDDVLVFLNRSSNSIKLLNWESGGFVLYYYKRLEKGTFSPPAIEGKDNMLKWPGLVLTQM